MRSNLSEVRQNSGPEVDPVYQHASIDELAEFLHDDKVVFKRLQKLTPVSNIQIQETCVF